MPSKLPCRFLRPATFRSFSTPPSHSHARFFSASRAILSQATDTSNDYQRRVSKLQAHRELAEYYPRVSELPSRSEVDQIPSLHDYETLKNGQTVEKQYGLHGRVKSVRRAGSSLLFIDLKRPSTNQAAIHTDFQVVVNYGRLGISDKSIWKRFEKVVRTGDWISVAGNPHRTDSGQLSLLASSMPHIVSPSLNQIPTEVEDQEKMSRHRHVDMIVSPRARDILRLRHEVIRAIRSFWESKSFIEVSTPLLAADAGGAAARPFETRASDFSNIPLSLRIAPELYLKRLVVGNMPRVFEIGQAFRNEAVDRTHNPEFTICEAYQSFISLADMISYIEELLLKIDRAVSELIRSGALESTISTPGCFAAAQHSSRRERFKQIDFIPALEQGITDRLEILRRERSDESSTSAEAYQLPDLSSPTAQAELVRLLETLGISIPLSPTLPRLLDRLQSTFLEPHCDGPTFIIYPPAALSPLAKTFIRNGQQIAARVELFIEGREYFNAYEEENSPFEQHRKFLEQQQYEQNATKTPAGSPEVPTEDQNVDPATETVVDDSYIEALGWGLPPVTGFGCGVDRLVMLFAGSDRLAEVLSFGNLRNVVSLAQNQPGR